MSYFVYILYSKKLNRFYTGVTADFDIRLDFHLHPEESRKFTAKATDWVEIWKLKVEKKSTAIKIERHIKSMKSKTYIRNLLKYPEIAEKLITKYDC